MVMVNRKQASMLLILALSLMFTQPAICEGFVENPKVLTLEAEQHWDTYVVGGTCCYGTHNLFLADVDSDSTMEIITGGFSYETANHTGRWEAPFKIWNWDGKNVTLEKSEGWIGSISAVYAADADDDGKAEVFTAGNAVNANGSGYAASLKVWIWNGEVLVQRASYEGVPASSIYVSDVDGDGISEIITVGRNYNSSQLGSQLCLWHLKDDALTLEVTKELSGTNIATASSVFACDVDSDSRTEIVIGGYANALNSSKGLLQIWNWDGEDFSQKAVVEWRKVDGYALNSAGGVQGNTVVNNVKVDDVDSDGTPEIVTGGFTYDGEEVNAELRTWSWSQNGVMLEKSRYWTTKNITEIKSVSINDVDGDGRKEIVTSGVSAAYGSFGDTNETQVAQLRVLRCDGKDLEFAQNLDWVSGEGSCAWNVGTGDLDNDGMVEIVTVGCISVENLCDPDMRVWSVAPLPMHGELLLAVVAVAAAGLLSGTYFLVKKLGNKKQVN
jgi:hypothetical protein